MTRGQAAERLGVNGETLRYYEQIGLVKPAVRSESGYRDYDEKTLERLELIIRLKKFGFSLKEIKQFMDLMNSSEKDRDRFTRFLEEKVKDLDEQIAGLRSVKNALVNFRDREDRESCSLFSRLMEE
ncbi:MAG: MerR family transcriptional regulator [Spirochaetales bacterium]|nr:MerR family transcriptional regulator [Spirochaetales bacterium]